MTTCVHCQKRVKDGINGECYATSDNDWWHWRCHTKAYHPVTITSVFKDDPVPWHLWPVIILLGPCFVALCLAGLMMSLATGSYHRDSYYD